MDTSIQIAARALWYVAPQRAELRAQTLSAPGEGQVLVGSRFSAVSRGTEGLVFRGAVPDSEHQRMRAPLQEGAFPFPVKYGYAVVGTIVDGDAAMKGRTVFVLHPHQDRFVAPASMAIAVPDKVPPRRAVLAANLETALNALWDGAALPGMRIAVVGAGVVGALVAWLAGQLPGSDVILVDVLPQRAELAARLGVAFALPDAAPEDCDLVFHASASTQGLATCLQAAGEEARIVELSWYGAQTISAELGAAFHSRRLILSSSQVGQVAPAMRPRWSHRRRLAKALELLTDARLDALLEPDVAFESLPAALPDLLAPGSGRLCQIVAYS